MQFNRVKINSIIKNQLPEFVEQEFPLVSEFLSAYYRSLESQGAPYDLIQNIDSYIKVDNLSNLNDSTLLTSNVDFFSDVIFVESTYGFPSSYGLLQINDEIITYTGITGNSFTGCIRGFSGNTSYDKSELTFTSSLSSTHSQGDEVYNLSILFLKKFFRKVKIQVTPGFEDQDFFDNLNQSLFIKQSNDFYSSKGTEESFKILFGALYGKPVEVIRPSDYLIQPSDAQYRIFKNLVVEAVEGDPFNLINATLIQDEDEFFIPAKASISRVEEIIRNEKKYHILSLDYDYNRDTSVRGTIQSEFTIHPKTLSVSNILKDSNFIDVDSTIGFPNSGKLIIQLENNIIFNVEYESKTINQFIGCTGIIQDIRDLTEIKLDSYAYGFFGKNRENIVKVRVTGVLEDISILDKNNTILQTNNSDIDIETLGNNIREVRGNNWIFNVPVFYNIKTISKENDNTYSIELYDDHRFIPGDVISIGINLGKVKIILDNKTLKISFDELVDLDISSATQIKKRVSKIKSTTKPELNVYNSNVQNVYYDNDDSFYICSHSLPSYPEKEIDPKDGSITFLGSFDDEEELFLNQDHFFYTGDSVVYKSSNDSQNSPLSDGVYYVKRINSNTIKLSRSVENIFKGVYSKLKGTSINDTISFFEFNDLNLNLKEIKPQKLVRKINSPSNEYGNFVTNPGNIGIFVNGVELLNYKSKDKVFYGPIEEIITISSGIQYDIINPPSIEIKDSIGFGCSAYCSIIGELERIDIVDPGFDYIEVPKVSITGGNGINAIAKVNLVQFIHFSEFNSENPSLVNVSNSSIGFSTYHKFRDYEEVIYDTKGQSSLSGLSTNSTYTVKVIDEKTIKLYKSTNDAILEINTIPFTSLGKGLQSFRSVKNKNKIGSISIENSGTNYANKKRTTLPVGIKTSNDTINIKNHGYKSGEIIRYDATDVPISGLSSGTNYFVKVIDDNNFRINNIGLTTNTKDFFYQTNQYVNLGDIGSGYHIFNYPPIEVKIDGIIGIKAFNNQDFSCKIIPVFRGIIDSIFVESGGFSYGVGDIINYNRQPQISAIQGSGAILSPIVTPDGKIVKINVLYGGLNYNCQPDINVSGDGSGAILTPIVKNGSIKEVLVISSGGGYFQRNTSIQVVSPGLGSKFESITKSWQINLYNRIINSNRISEDSGIISSSLNPNFGLQYTHLYASESIRSIVYGKKNINGKLFFVPDIENDSIDSSLYHSPIIGWAYDGNPIYGPYGYSSPSGVSGVKMLQSGYIQREDNDLINEGRPPFSESYPSGFFIEDYIFNSNGDLDDNNGRFCVTPEFPNGIYAYFCTLDESKNPIFPYIIGNTYKSLPINFNYVVSSNQDQIDFNKYGWVRNTNPYEILSKNSGYNYFKNISPKNKKIAEISNISTGSISNIKIIESGKNYKVDDIVIFENEDGSGKSLSANVSEIKGEDVNQIGIAVTSYENVEFVPTKNGLSFLGFSTIPHGLKTNDIITVISEYDYNKTSSINTSSNRLTLSVGVGTTGNTGLVTYFNVIGFLDESFIMENDVYTISSEKVKILNVDQKSSRIRVLRNINNQIGISSYSIGTSLFEDTRKFKFNLGISTSYYNYKLNKEFYFNPQESISLGSVGINSTLYFENPGVGSTYITIPSKSIYLDNHNLKSGDQLFYSSNGGSSILASTDTVSSFILNDNSIVYVSKINEYLIGISTIANDTETLYFMGVGSGEYHSLKTNYQKTFIGEIVNNKVNVTTSSSHGLSLNDMVNIDVRSGISTTVIIKYDDYNRRMVANPKQIESVDVNNDILIIPNHGYFTGDKVICNLLSPISGLFNNKIYYVIYVSRNKIKLSNSLYDSNNNQQSVVNIISSGSGSLSQINPPLSILNGETIIFDLSDSSLSYTKNSIKSAFDFNLYTDSNFKQQFIFSGKDNMVEVTRVGTIGISPNAGLSLRITDNIPKKLYYSLKPINLNDNLEVKKEIILDYEQANNNIIKIIDSAYSGVHKITKITNNTFSYNIKNITPEKNIYTQNNSIISYTTNSINAFGSINKVKITNFGFGYKRLPKINYIQTINGSGAILDIETTNIGLINKTKINDIGYEYSSDFTIRPKAKIPKILRIETSTIFDSIQVTSNGINYTNSPNILVIDGLTNQIVTDVELKYDLRENSVIIIKNTQGISNIDPRILSINNSNGIGINSIGYDTNTKNVILTLEGTFQSISQFPFNIGDEIMIENVFIPNEGKGYNSENYDYAFFKIINVAVNIGVTTNPTITYNLSDYLIDDELPGVYDSTFIRGFVIPVKNLISFTPILTKLPFLEKEIIISFDGKSGEVQLWDSFGSHLSILTNDEFKIGDSILGKTSNSLGKILEIYESNKSYYNINSSSIVEKGWEKETGFLNNNLQRTHDSDYYQYFSYSLKSEIELNKWDNIVNLLNHTSGFKRFSNLIVDSSSSLNDSIGIPTSLGSTSESFVEIQSFGDVNCLYDIDLVLEVSVLFPTGYKSSQVYMNNLLLKDYFKMLGNRVLVVDDISNQFNNSLTSFNITSNSIPVFKREFVGSAISLTDSTISIPNNFYSTGEKVTYIPPTDGNPIGIATTSISGISTDILPPNIYIVRDNDLNIRVSSSSTDSLKDSPNILTFTSIGTGTTHTFISKNQNSKVIFTVDGIIQSPLVPTNFATTLTSSISISTTILPVSGITSIFSGNFIKINDEVMKVTSSTNGNIEVVRPVAGTYSTSHNNGSEIIKINGNYNIVDNTLHFVSPPIGKTPIETNLPDEIDFSGISKGSYFSGRVFLRSGIVNTEEEAYYNNYIFDDISNQFDGFNKDFSLKSNGQNVSEFSNGYPTILVNNVFQSPIGLNIAGNYDLEENAGITTISFTGTASSVSYDVNNSNVPRGGIIVSVASTQGFGYQPLVSAGGTAVVSISGTIQNISIGNSGSGYRSGMQSVNIGVTTNGTDVFVVGIASIAGGNVVGVSITNPGSDYLIINPPEVIFDPPLPYSNIPLVYSQDSQSGIGTYSIIDIVVGQGSSVISFEIKNLGYGYNVGDVLTVEIGGSTGIPTNFGYFEEFKVEVERSFSDNFSGWYFGDLEVFDPLDRYFNGVRRIFALRKNNEPQTVTSAPGSNIIPQNSLLVFINDVLQTPDKDYTFNGSFIEFNESIQNESSSKILLYKGTSSVDVEFIDIIPSIKIGDDITLNDDNFVYKQEDRTVLDINSPVIVDTNIYPGPGINTNDSYLRPLKWCIQKNDRIINGQEITKDREIFEPSIFPTTTIISDINIDSNQIFVESIKTFFDSNNEGPRYEVVISSQDNKVSASCTAIITNGSVTSYSIVNSGIGYTLAPTVSISSPTGLGTVAIAESAILNGSVISINPISIGSGYNIVPEVILSSPTMKTELITEVEYDGDFGIITGIQTTTYGGLSALTFDFYIPNNSYLKDLNITNPAITISGISSEYYFVVSNSNIGGITTSRDISGSIIGVSSYIDNVYQVSNVAIGFTNVPGQLGTVQVAKVTVKCDYSNMTGIGYSFYYGNYSWGRLHGFDRRFPQQFISYNQNGFIGIESSPIVYRFNPLKFRNYLT
jgi:hypothetical protein